MARIRHTIVHQYDPDRHVAGGIDGFIHDFVEVAVEERHVRVIGVTGRRSARRLGTPVVVGVERGSFEFIPVARLTTGDQHRIVPHTFRVAAGLARHRLRVDCSSDIVHFHRSDLAVAARPFLHPAHTALFVHGSPREAMAQRAETVWRLAPRAYLRIEEAAVKQADSVRVMHARAADELRAVNPAVRHGQNWFDERCFFPPASRSDTQPHILWAGRLEPPKDPVLAVQAIAEVRRLFPHVTAAVIGNGTLEAEVRRAIRDLELADAVVMRQTVSAAELADEMRRSHVLLVTSTWEGIPRLVIEALACGLPTVCTSVGDLPRMVSAANGAVAMTRRPSDVAAGVDCVLNSQLAPDRVAATVEHLGAKQTIRRLLGEIEAAACLGVAG